MCSIICSVHICLRCWFAIFLWRCIFLYHLFVSEFSSMFEGLLSSVQKDSPAVHSLVDVALQECRSPLTKGISPFHHIKSHRSHICVVRPTNRFALSALSVCARHRVAGVFSPAVLEQVTLSAFGSQLLKWTLAEKLLALYVAKGEYQISPALNFSLTSVCVQIFSCPIQATALLN